MAFVQIQRTDWYNSPILLNYHKMNLLIKYSRTIVMNDAYPLYCVKISAVIGGILVLAILLDKVRMLIFKPLISWSGKFKMLN